MHSAHCLWFDQKGASYIIRAIDRGAMLTKAVVYSMFDNTVPEDLLWSGEQTTRDKLLIRAMGNRQCYLQSSYICHILYKYILREQYKWGCSHGHR